MGKKWKELRGGALPYVIASLSLTLAIMNLQMMARFHYFHFCINVLKWRSSISGFRQKFLITFIIKQPIETYKKVLAICEFFPLKYSEFGPFRPRFYFFKSNFFLSCQMLMTF